MRIEYDQRADAAYVYLMEHRKVARTKTLDENRNIDYDAEGQAVGVEFLSVSRGVDVDGLPHRDEIARWFGDRHIPLYA